MPPLIIGRATLTVQHNIQNTNTTHDSRNVNLHQQQAEERAMIMHIEVSEV